MNLVAFPIIIPILGAALCLLGWQNRAFQRIISILFGIAQVAVALKLLSLAYQGEILTLAVGGWSAPFGIVLVVDIFSAIMVLVAAVIILAVTLYSFESMDNAREKSGYYCLLQVLLAGVSGSFITGDIFNLYVWFEVMLIGSFVLMSLGCEKEQMQGGIKYVVINLLASAFFLAATALLYGMTGTLNFAALSIALAEYPNQGLVLALGMLFFIAFGIKAAVFPLFFWLPSSYHTPPIAISAVLAGLLTKVGVYALIRVFTLLIIDTTGYIQNLMLIVAGLTMITGVLGAIAQNDMRKILSFHIISQIGYMIMGLGIYTKTALAGSIFYIAHHIVVKTNLFLIAGAIHRMKGSYLLKDLGGIYKYSFVWALAFIIPAFSLAGIPPLSGFFSKFILVKAGLESTQYPIVWIALGCGLLTLYSMTKIWNEVYWKKASDQNTKIQSVGFCMSFPIGALAMITVLIGLFSGALFDLTNRAASQLLNPQGYIQAVLSEGLIR